MRSSAGILLDIGIVRIEASITTNLLLFSRLDKVTSPKLGRGATTDGNPNVHQEIGDNLFDKASSDNHKPGWRRW